MEIKNLTELREFGEERFTKRIVHKKDESVVFILNFKPGQELPTHQHPGTAVYLLVLEGEGDVTINGSATKVSKDDVIWVDGEEQFSFKNTGSANVTLYVMLAKIPDARFAENL